MSEHPFNRVQKTITNNFSRIINIGIHPGMPFIEARRTKLLNLLALPWIPMMLMFAVVNMLQGRYPLSVINVLNAAGSLTVLFLHKRQLYLSARLLLIVYSIILYTLSGFFYHNGTEFFLMNILIITILVYDNKWIVISLSMLIIVCMIVVLFPPYHWEPNVPVPERRLWGNVVCALTFIILALTYYKQVHADYQQEKENQRQALAAMNRDKEKLFSIIAHDIRGPLATLELLLDMFQKGEYGETDMREAAIELHKKVGQLGGTLDNLLRWSAGQMKGIRAQPENFNLAPLTAEVLQFFESGIEEKRIEIEIRLAESIAVYADKDQVAVILRNLLSNAIKFSHPGGKIYFSVNSAGGMIHIQVTDEGVGIPPEKMNQLFSFQARPGYGTSGERGSGLGLMLCHEFAIQNGGHLQVKSNNGSGSTFVVQLPEGRIKGFSLS